MKILTLFLFAFISIVVNSFSQSNGIIFTEDFEEATLTDMSARWNEAKNLAGMSFSVDVPPGSSGNHSIMMTSIIGQNTGGHLYKMFPVGYDSLFARFYVKFATTHHPVHHFVHTGGYNPPTRWPQGGAGERPVGNERFTTGIEPIGSRWSWDFYSYWMHMRGNAQPGTYWGNIFNPTPPAPIERDKWYCVELMMKVNDPVTAWNGEQAFWVDGKKIHHLGYHFPNGYWIWDKFNPQPDSLPFEGFQWRIDEDLKLNFFWLLYYMTEGAAGQTDSVWFDDIVISTNYIGPTSSIKDEISNENNFAITISPNPFSNNCRIDLSSNILNIEEAVIYNIIGIPVKKLNINELDINKSVSWLPEGLCAGMYFLNVRFNEKVVTKPIIYF